MLIKTSYYFFHCQGHDTTASALAFILYNIAKHEDIQRKCYEEIQNILGSDGRVNMKYDIILL